MKLPSNDMGRMCLKVADRCAIRNLKYQKDSVGIFKCLYVDGFNLTSAIAEAALVTFLFWNRCFPRVDSNRPTPINPPLDNWFIEHRSGKFRVCCLGRVYSLLLILFILLRPLGAPQWLPASLASIGFLVSLSLNWDAAAYFGLIILLEMLLAESRH
jgi:hypothetical protein